MTKINRFTQRQGSALVKVIVVAAIGIGLLMVVMQLGDIGVAQKANVRAKSRFFDLGNEVRVLLNHQSFCGANAFKGSNGSPISFGGSDVSVDEVWLGGRSLLKVDSERNGIKISGMTLKPIERIAPRRWLVQFEVRGGPVARLIGPGQLAPLRFKMELGLNQDGTVRSCLDRELYLQTAIASRSGFTLPNIGCTSTEIEPVPAGLPGTQNWAFAATAYRRVITAPPPPGPPVPQFAVVGDIRCMPHDGERCYDSCPNNTLLNGDAGCTPQPATQSGFQTTSTWKIPVLSFCRPGQNYTGGPLASTCGDLSTLNPQLHCVDPAVTPGTCSNFAMGGGKPFNAVPPPTVEHSASRADRWQTEWLDYFPVRRASAPKIDLKYDVNPPGLAANERRCWVSVLDRPDNPPAPSAPLSADDIFLVSADLTERHLHLGCRADNQWSLLGCSMSSSGLAARADNDMGISNMDRPDLNPPAIGKYCHTGDITQPHIAGLWGTDKISIYALCGRVVPPTVD